MNPLCLCWSLLFRGLKSRAGAGERACKDRSSLSPIPQAGRLRPGEIQNGPRKGAGCSSGSVPCGHVLIFHCWSLAWELQVAIDRLGGPVQVLVVHVEVTVL